MRWMYLCITGLILLTGCATKLRAPLNRMVSPETVGGVFNSEFEISQQNQADGKVDVSQPTPYPIKFTQQGAMGYYGAFSLGDSLDLTWQHTASAASMLGFKWQFLGNSLQQAGAGHSMTLTAAFGGNEHEIDGNPKVQFKVGATDFALIHGYWLIPSWQVFETVAVSHYSYDGKLSGTNAGNFKDDGKFLTLAAGTALVFRPFKLKAEASYVQADWSGTGKENYLAFAFGLGLFF